MTSLSVAGIICLPPCLFHLVVAVGVKEKRVHLLLCGGALLLEPSLFRSTRHDINKM
jgi:hypothetical protein